MSTMATLRIRKALERFRFVCRQDMDMEDAEQELLAAIFISSSEPLNALEAMYRMHVRESGHRHGECANCFVALAVLTEAGRLVTPLYDKEIKP